MNCRMLRVALLMPVLLAGVTTPVQAQESPTYLRQLRGAQIPMAEAQFLLYQYVAGSADEEPDRRLQDEVRTRLNFGNARFYALLDHMREAIEASRAFSDAQTSALCARRGQLDSVKALGAALNTSLEALQARQAQLVEEAKPILGSEGESKFADMLAEYRERMVVNRVDYTALLEARQLDAATALSGICDRVDEVDQPEKESSQQ